MPWIDVGMYAYLEFKIGGEESPRVRLTFTETAESNTLSLVQVQMEGHSRVTVCQEKEYIYSAGLEGLKIWGEDLGLGEVWLDLQISPARLPTFEWNEAKIRRTWVPPSAPSQDGASRGLP